MTRSTVLFSLLFVAIGAARADVDALRRGAAITLKVSSFTDAEAKLLALVDEHHGLAADRRQVSSEGGRLSGWTRVVLPKTQLDSFLADLRQLGKSYGEKLNMADGSSLYEDLGKRAERLRQHEQRLSNVLAQRKGLRGSDILFVQERLYRASTDEDTLTEQRDAVPARAAKSSVVVTFFEPAPIKEEPRGIAGHVKATFEEALRGLAFTLLSWVGTLMNWSIMAIGAGLVWFLFRRPIRATFRRVKEVIGASVVLQRPVAATAGPQPAATEENNGGSL